MNNSVLYKHHSVDINSEVRFGYSTKFIYSMPPIRQHDVNDFIQVSLKLVPYRYYIHYITTLYDLYSPF
jgi:hypothetical protein